MINVSEKIREGLVANPALPITKLAKKLRVKPSYIYQIKWQMKQKRKKLNGSKTNGHDISELSSLPTIGSARTSTEHERDSLVTLESKQSHDDTPLYSAPYLKGGIDTLDFIEAKSLSYGLGRAVKYITKAEHEGAVKNLTIAKFYIDREIAKFQEI
jgi:hypothetical protein